MAYFSGVPTPEWPTAVDAWPDNPQPPEGDGESSSSSNKVRAVETAMAQTTKKARDKRVAEEEPSSKRRKTSKSTF